MTQGEAIAKYESGWWRDATDAEIVDFQLYESRLCMPFGDFQLAVERVLGHPVWTHQFTTDGAKKLQAEYERKKAEAMR